MYTGIMLAFYLPSDAAEQLVALTETAGLTPVAPEAMHLTLVYMGDMGDYDDGEQADIQSGVQRFIDGQGVAISGSVSGLGRFNTAEGSDTNALYASFDSPDLPTFRENLFGSVVWHLAVEPEHGFTPHITLAYIPADAPTPDIELPALNIAFDRLTLAWGDDHIHYDISKAGKTMSEQKAGAKDEVKGKVYRPFSQKETAYTTLHTNPTQACANCRFFKAHSWGADGPACHIVEDWPESILATGWCNEWREVVVIVDEVESVEELVGTMTAHERKAVGQWIGKIQRLIGRKSKTQEVGFKISDDGKRWEALYTNNWRDDDGELFPEAGIDRFIARVKTRQAPWPELQYAHLSGLAHGVADNLIRIGHHVLATGAFDDTDLAAKLRDHGRKCIQDGKPLALSHRFWFNSKTRTPTGEYEDFDTFEISWFEVLPGVRPANPFTLWEMKTMSEQLPPALVQNLESILGKQRAQELISLSAQRDEKALAERRDSKTFTPPPTDWEAKFADQDTRIDRAVTALETATKTVTDTGMKFDNRLTALEKGFGDFKARFEKENELAPPGSRNSATKLGADNRIAKWLDTQEAKAESGDNPSLVEFALGVKIGDAPTQVTPGGQP